MCTLSFVRYVCPFTSTVRRRQRPLNGTSRNRLKRLMNPPVILSLSGRHPLPCRLALEFFEGTYSAGITIFLKSAKIVL